MIGCASGITWVDSGAELVLFDAGDGSYHALNPSASRIWLLLAGGASPAEVGASIAAEFGLSLDLAQQSVDGFVEDALAKGLLVAQA